MISLIAVRIIIINIFLTKKYTVHKSQRFKNTDPILEHFNNIPFIKTLNFDLLEFCGISGPINRA